MTSDRSSSPGASPLPLWRERWLWIAVAAALVLRTAAFLADYREPDRGMPRGYVSWAATLASGYGLLLSESQKPPEGEPLPPTGPEFMKARQAEGGRVDPDHRYPADPTGWIPSTKRPAGYPVLLYLLYRIGNYDGMIFLLHALQALLDSLTCVLLFAFARNVFDRRVGLWSAWIYAFLPPAVFLTLPILPDAMGRFLLALVLCMASYARPGRGWMLLVAGGVCGLASQFRPEFLLLPVGLFLALWAWRRRFWSTLGWTAGMQVAVVVMLVPWMVWTWRATGTMLLTCTTSGGTAYESLGEDPKNRWGIVLSDEWLIEDAVKRGYPTAWCHDADVFYRRQFIEHLREDPVYYLRLVLVHRLPLALAPPYQVFQEDPDSEFRFSKVMQKEGLSRWGVVRKYPMKVVARFGPRLIMLGLSGLLTLNLFWVLVAMRRRWRQMAWLLVPWLYVVGTMVLLKFVEPRNVSGVLVVQTVALALTAIALVDRRRRAARLQDSSGPV